MRARHTSRHRRVHGEAARASGGGVHRHPLKAMQGEGSAAKMHAARRARGGTCWYCGDDFGKDGRKSGGGKWIQGAIKHPGALHRALHVPEGQKIPAKKLAKAAHSSNPTMRRRANLAKTLKKMH